MGTPALPAKAAPRVVVENWMRQLQEWLCYRCESADGGGTHFSEQKSGEGGTERRCVLLNGSTLEQGIIVFGARSGAADWPEQPVFQTGVSVVLHPFSPQVPSGYLNLTYGELATGEGWFGGGLDLSPIYVDAAQARWFHEQLRQVCQRYDASFYPRFKAAADDYFYLPHRQETRGIGGIYFERLRVGADGLFEELFAFVQDVAEVFCRTYLTLMQQNAARPYSSREKRWQRVRRDRFTELLLTGEHAPWPSVLAPEKEAGTLQPLPILRAPLTPEPESPEATTQQWLRKGVDWLAA